MLQQPVVQNDHLALQRSIHQWQISTFKYDRHPAAVLLAHFRKELDEIIIDPDDPFEYADALNLLLAAIAFSPFSWDAIVETGWEKHTLVKARTWGDPNKKTGIIEHVGERSESAAHRIVAAVRAVDGMPTDALERGALRELIGAAKDALSFLEDAAPSVRSRKRELVTSRLQTALSKL